MPLAELKVEIIFFLIFHKVSVQRVLNLEEFTMYGAQASKH